LSSTLLPSFPGRARSLILAGTLPVQR